MGNFDLFRKVDVFLNAKITIWVHKMYYRIAKIPLLHFFSPVMFIARKLPS